MSKSQKQLADSWLWSHVAPNRIALHTISPEKVEPSATPVTKESRDELVCSYNWLKGNGLNIKTPGFAPTWKPLALPVTLPPDKGYYNVDLNGARMPRFPFEPLFRATSIMRPEFCFDNVDVVVNRNSLRKLLDLCHGRVETSFRLNLLRVGRTLIIERCERKVREKIRGDAKFGSQLSWGHTFEEQSVQFPSGTGCEQSAGHHRALRYNLGDVRCVVQFEVDASYEGTAALADDASQHDSLTDTLSQLSIADSPTANGTKSLLTASRGGQLQPQSAMAEIKSMSLQKNATSKYIPQLWFGRTPWLLIGRHTRGKFQEVRDIHAADSFAAWEDAHQTTLRKLAALLAQLRDNVLQLSSSGNSSSFVAICEKSGSRAIRIFASTEHGKQTLPDDLIEKFWSSPAKTMAEKI